MKIKNLDHLVITTNDLEKCIYFYTDILGMELDNKNGRYAVKFGNQKINIHEKDSNFLPVAKNVMIGSTDICLIVEDKIEAVYKELEEKKVAMEVGIVDRTGALGKIRSIYIRDYDGNLIELSTYE